MIGAQLKAINDSNSAAFKNYKDLTSGMTVAFKAARGNSMNNMMGTKLSDTLASGKQTMITILRNGFLFTQHLLQIFDIIISKGGD